MLDQYGLLREIPPGGVVYVPVDRFSWLREEEVELVSNFFSLGEMRRESFDHYIRSPLFKKAKSIYLVNRFVSAPFFEPTYDNDLTILDYMTKSGEVTYFDIFPIHYFLKMSRELFGRREVRNLSSPYFELVRKLST